MSEIVDIVFYTNAAEYEAESRRIEKSITGVERSSKSTTSQIVGDSRRIEQSSERVDGMYKQLCSTLAKVGGTVAVATLAKQLYDFAKAFDLSMTEVATISQNVAYNMESFKRQVLELGTRVPIAADAAGKALYQIVSAGYDGAAGMTLLEVASKSAIAGMTDTTTAADAITTSLNAYKMSAESAAKVSDLLFMTAKLGKTTFGQLGQSISQAAPIAAAYGVELEQVLAAVATLTKSGTPTAQAMTQIRSAIISVSKYLGDGAFDAMTFQEALSLIAQKANGSEDALRGMITETEAISGLLGLTGINARMAADDLAAMGGAAGETEKAFALMVDKADAQLSILKNNMLKKFHEMGATALDSVTGISKALNEAFETGTMDDVIATLGVLIAMFGTYKAALIASAVYQKALAATEMLRTLNQTTAALGRAAQAQKLLNAAMGANPVAKVVSLLMAAGAALYLFSSKAKTTKDIIAELNTSSDQYDKTVKSLSGSISRYDELQRKANSNAELTKDEHTELNSIMETMLLTVPNLKGKFDEYGNALSVNMDVVKAYSRMQKEAYKDVLQDNIKTAEQEKKVLEGQLETQRKIFMEGKKLGYGSVQNGQFGGTTTFESVVAASAEDMKLARGEWTRLNADLVEISTSITKSKNVLDGVNESLGDGDKSKAAAATPATYGASYKAAQAEWSEAKKELSKIEKDKDSFTKKQYDDAKKRVTDAEAAYSAIGGQTKATKDDKSTSDKLKNNQSKIDAERTLKDALVDVVFETEQAIIDAQQSGYEREMAQIELNYRKKQTAIELWEREQRKVVVEAQKAAFVAKGGKETDFKTDNNDAPFIPINKAYDAKSTSNAAERGEAEKQLLADLRQQWQDWGDEYQQIENKLTEIAKKAAKDRADIAASVSSGKLTKEQGINATEMVNKGEQTATVDLTSAKTKLSAEWSQVFRDLQGMSRTQVNVLIDEINAQLSSSKLSAADSSALLEQLNRAKEYSISLNPFASLISGIGDVRTATENLEQAKIKLEAVKSNGGSKQDLEAATKEKIAAEKAVADTKKQRNDAASKSIRDVASIAGATSDMLKTFGVESPAVDGVVNSLSALSEINFSNAISIITGGLKAVGSLLAGIFGEMDAVKERKIQQIQKQVDALEKSYDKLGDAIGKAYSSSAASLIRQQDEMLQQQKRLIEQQKKEEQSKKDSDKGKVDSYTQAQQEIDKQLAESKDKARDAIFGSDLQSDIDNFASAYMSAWDGGENRAMAQKDVVKKMIKGIIQEMLKSDIAGQVDQMRKRIEGFMSDDVLSDDELAEIDNMSAQIGNIMEQRGKMYDKILKSDTVNADSLTGAIRGTVATEASVSELKGIMQRDSDNIHAINTKLDLGFRDIAEAARYAKEIAANTLRTADNTEKIAETNKKLDTIIKNTAPDNGTIK